jgi:WD40 repeat protein
MNHIKNGLYNPTVVLGQNSGSMAAVEAVSTGFPVTLTLYMHSWDVFGPKISGVSVTGQDGAGHSFEQTTDSNGCVTITGIAGIWSFTASADEYETTNWDWEITESDAEYSSSLKKSTSQSVKEPHGQEIQKLNHSDAVYSVAFSPDGKTLATASRINYIGDSKINFWDVASGKLIHMGLDLYGLEVYSLAFSPNGKELVVGGRAGYYTPIRVWDMTNMKNPLMLSEYGKDAKSVSFSPDGSKIAAGCYDSVQIWDTTSGRELPSFGFDNMDYWIYSIAFSPDGTMLAAANSSTAKIWDIASGKELKKLSVGNEDGIGSVAFSPDGTTLATGYYNMARIWDVKSGKILQSLYREEGPVDCMSQVAFSPDGTLLATAGMSGPIGIWDIASGRELKNLSIGNSDPIQSIVFNHDGTLLATGSQDNTARIWDATIQGASSKSQQKSPGFAGILAVSALVCTFFILRRRHIDSICVSCEDPSSSSSCDGLECK